MEFLKTIKPFWFYTFISLFILGPLLAPGYLFLLDMTWAPRLPWPTEVTSSFLVRAGLSLLSIVVPSDLLQKILLWLILMLMGWGMHRLLVKHQPKLQSWSVYFAALVYTINPFTYTRFMEGHWNVLFGYALLPWLTNVWFSFLKQPRIKPAARVSIIVLSISIVSLHTIYMAALIMLVTSIFYWWHHQQLKSDLKRFLGLSFLILGTVLVLSSYWLIPYIKGQSQQAVLVQSFDERHVLSFRTATDQTFGTTMNVLALYGYWGDREDRYVLPKAINPLWPGLGLGLLGLVGYGFIVCLKRSSWLAWSLAVIGMVALVLAIGVAHSWTAPISRWLLEHAPFFNGYREPQKFVGLLVLVYAYLGALGADSIVTKIQSKHSGIYSYIVAGLLLSPWLYTPTMLGGMAGQLQARHYPNEWYIAESIFSQDSSSYKVLFLPWHQYLHFNFAGRVISNPAKDFFSVPVVQSDQPEIGLIQGDSEKQDPGQLVKQKEIKYVILAKEADWESYTFLNHSNDFEVILNTDSLVLYRNLKSE